MAKAKTKPPPRWRQVVSQTYKSWNEHRSFTESASLAFYTLFSLAPILIVTITIASAFFGEEAVRGQVVHQFARLMGANQAALVESILKRVAHEEKSAFGAVFGGLVVLFGATAVFAQLQSSLNRVWEVEPRRGHLIRSLLQKRLASFALLLGIGFLLLVSLVLSAAISSFQSWVERGWEVSPLLLQSANICVTFLLFTLLFAMIYRILPDREIAWRDVALGAIAASVAFDLGKWLFGLYIGETGIASPYGTAGSLVVILLWIFYATSTLLLGAEFTRAYSKVMLDSHPETTAGATRVKEVKVELTKDGKEKKT